MYNDDDYKLKKRETDRNIFKEEHILVTSSDHFKRCADALERIVDILWEDPKNIRKNLTASDLSFSLLPASNGDESLCDIVIYSGNKEMGRFENEVYFGKQQKVFKK